MIFCVTLKENQELLVWVRVTVAQVPRTGKPKAKSIITSIASYALQRSLNSDVQDSPAHRSNLELSRTPQLAVCKHHHLRGAQGNSNTQRMVSTIKCVCMTSYHWNKG